jgi:hypothetical protein
MFAVSDGNPAPTNVAGTGLAAGSRQWIAPGERTAGRLHPASEAARFGAGAGRLVGEDAALPRGYLEQTGRRIGGAGCARKSGSVLTAPTESCAGKDVPSPEA